MSVWKKFDYHDIPPGTDRDSTGRLVDVSDRDDVPREENEDGEGRESRRPDPDIVLRVSGSTLTEARSVLDAYLVEYRVTPDGLVFRSAVDRDLAKALLEPVIGRTA